MSGVSLDDRTPNPSPPSAEHLTGQLVELTELSVRYSSQRGFLGRSRSEVVAVDGVTLSIQRGRTLGLVGATGSGKSTIAQVVMGMVEPTSGSVVVAGHDLGIIRGRERRSLRRLVQVVFQDPYSSFDPRMKVRDIIAEPLTLGRPVFGSRRRQIDERVAELLNLVGLPANRAERYPHQFSGGQRQRIAIARALAPRPQLIVLDEPTSALDVSIRAQILTLLKNLQGELGVTYLVISHDLVTVAYLASEVAVMHLGRIIERAPTLTIYRRPLHPYTLELLASVPGANGAFLNQPRPVGMSASSLPAGACQYAYRCMLRTRLGNPSRCLDEDPALNEVETDHEVACHFPQGALKMVESVGRPGSATEAPGA